MTVVDAHHHLWDPARRDYSFLRRAGLEPLRRPFGVGDLRAAIAGTPVTRTVVVQATASLDEARDLLAAAEGSDGLIAGVVGWVDLTGDTEAGIAALRAAPGGDRLVGVRHQVEDEPDPRWLSRPQVRSGLAAVAAAGLAYDLLVRPPQLPAAIETVRALPELRVVLDHGAKPPIATGDLAAWRALVAELASAPNVVCKLSGLVTEADWRAWRAGEILAVAEHLLACFGPDRLMFGSDWPVCTLAAGFGDVLALARRSLDGLAEPERDGVLGGVATRVYVLNIG